MFLDVIQCVVLCMCSVVAYKLRVCYCVIFFFKQKTAYEMRISDWSSDVCSSDLDPGDRPGQGGDGRDARPHEEVPGRGVGRHEEARRAGQGAGDRKSVV